MFRIALVLCSLIVVCNVVEARGCRQSGNSCQSACQTTGNRQQPQPANGRRYFSPIFHRHAVIQPSCGSCGNNNSVINAAVNAVTLPVRVLSNAGGCSNGTCSTKR